jgi:hypothetical protein
LAQGGAAAAVHRWHGLEVEDQGLLKDLVVISFFLGCFVPSGVYLMIVSYSQKKIWLRLCLPAIQFGLNHLS